jgi:NADPH-dependent curcumin reductase CurA
MASHHKGNSRREGFDHAMSAFPGLFHGENAGQMVVMLASWRRETL